MNIEITKTISVLPILIINSDEENAVYIANCISLQDSDRNIKIHGHCIVKEGLIILLEGVIGNLLDNLLIELSGIEKNGEIAYCQLQRAKKLANTISDEKYKTLVAGGYSEYFNLRENLTDIWS